MRLTFLVLPLFWGTTFAVVGEGFLSTISGAVSRVKNGLAYYMPKLGSCPVMPAQQNLADDIDDFLGSWYVQSALNNEVLQGQARYMSARIEYDGAADTLKIKAQQLNEGNHQWGHLEASAKVANKTLDEFKFQASFNLPVYGQLGGTYTLIKSDFQKYGVLHGCGSLWSLLYYDIIWMASRKQELTPEEEKEFNRLTRDALSDFTFIDPAKFTNIKQMDTSEPDD